MNKFRSRRWLLAVFFSIVGTIALFTKFMDAGVYMALVTIIMGIYTSADTYEKVSNDTLQDDT